MIRAIRAACTLLALLPTLAHAGAPITDFRDPVLPPPGTPAPGGLPDPQRAASLSARWTLLPIGIGTAICALGTMGRSGGASRDYGPAAGGMLVLGVAVATAGIVVGPSAGYGYGGLESRGTAGTIVRLGSLLAPSFVLGTQYSKQGSGDAGFAALAGAVLGAGLVTLEACYDVLTVEGSVRRHNEAISRPTTWRIEPCTTPSAHAPGLALRAHFAGPPGP